MDLAALQQNVPLAKYTSFRVGGPAQYFCEVHNLDDFKQAIALADSQKMRYFILGSGTNVLFPDKGFDGLVIKNACDGIVCQDQSIQAESGALLSQVITLARAQKMYGLETFWGLPGTIGGAVRGNAGSFGVWIGEFVTHVRVWLNGQELTWKQDDLQFAYRSSLIKSSGAVILQVTLSWPRQEVKMELEEMNAKRRAKQPVGFSAGSFFKNPAEGKSAGELIEAAGLKGLKIGGAQVSPKHANFIMNTGGATAADILTLAKKVQAEVHGKFGIQLEPEVMIVS